MARVKRGVHSKKKHKAVMDRAKGFRGARSRRFKVAKEAVMHAERYAYRDRRARKGDFRRLWITRINAAARMDGLSYSRFMHGLKLAEVEVDRKILADLAVREPAGFSALVVVAKDALGVEHDGPATDRTPPADAHRGNGWSAPVSEASASEASASEAPAGGSAPTVDPDTTDHDGSEVDGDASPRADDLPWGEGSAQPDDDGSGPDGWTVKGNADSMLFHTEDSPNYERTNAEVWFETEQAAADAGFERWDHDTPADDDVEVVDEADA